MHIAAVKVMIRVDNGAFLTKIFESAAVKLPEWRRLEVLSPFFDTDASTWSLMHSARKSGLAVRLFTRWPEEREKQAALILCQTLGIRVELAANLHAKGVLLLGTSARYHAGWIGSHNLTRSSEVVCFELGVAFAGEGRLEAELYRDLLSWISSLEQRTKRIVLRGTSGIQRTWRNEKCRK
jgi:phosphatidylserine/phosphatidylglycerophosphate/cardiolipin synthase-like enzyme